MKYLKLVFALIIFLVVCLMGYSIIKPVSTNNLVVNNSLIDTTTTNRSIENFNKTKRDSIVNFAMKYLGTPYIYGSSNKNGFDCSGFVYFVFRHFDIDVPRSSSEYKNFGKTISIDKVEKGDILVFLSPTRDDAIGHIGIVTTPKGMETEFIHASSGKEMKVIYSNLEDPGYKRRFVKAITVL